MPSSISILFDHIERAVKELHNAIRWKSFQKMEIEFEKLMAFLDCLKSHFSQEFVETTFAYVDQHLHFVERYIEERNLEMVKQNFDDIRQRDLPKIKSKVYALLESQKTSVYSKEEKVYPKGHIYDFYKDIRSITKDAENEVFVVDAYVDEELLNLNQGVRSRDDGKRLSGSSYPR